MGFYFLRLHTTDMETLRVKASSYSLLFQSPLKTQSKFRSPYKPKMPATNTDDPEVLRTLLSDLESDLKDKCAENSDFEAEIRGLQKKLAMKDAEIMRQERELHKLRVRLQTWTLYFETSKGEIANLDFRL